LTAQNKRQRPIPVTDSERTKLEQYKRQYEEHSGEGGDWGAFLGTIALLGLAAAGVYALVQATRQTPQSANVICSECHQQFVIALPVNAQNVVAVRCPHCQRDLVVQTENA
jgi:DNA-directed RNA polymerase subunit RPC12/RpoP